MTQYKELVREVLASMARTASLVDDTRNANRAEFYKRTSAPLALFAEDESDGVYQDTVYKSICNTVRALMTGLNLHATSWCRVQGDANKSKCEFNLAIYFTSGESPTKFEVDVTRAVKHSKTLTTVVEGLIKQLKNHKGANINFDIEQCTSTWLQYRVKCMMNDIKAIQAKYYMYFADRNYAGHYGVMHETQNLRSCMSYEARHFGNVDADGDYIHPLDGYTGAPDFRLGLVSKYSPEEILNAEEYPFIARTVVSYQLIDNEVELSYGKIYGDETSFPSVRSSLLNENPVGRQFYATVARGITINTVENNSSTVRLFSWWYDCGENIQGHFVAPYIDTYNNFFELDPCILTNPITDREVVLCTVLDKNEDDYDSYGYGIYHGTGIVDRISSNDDIDEYVYLDHNDNLEFEDY